MKDDIINGLFKVVAHRKENHKEGSYTCYLFREGLDKILKKCGEECAETIIAAKNGDGSEIKNEVADLVYHLIVMLVELGIDYDEVADVLKDRAAVLGRV